jgi:hypothetical protein
MRKRDKNSAKMDADQELRDSFLKCEVEGCELPAKKQSCFCDKHYKQVIQVNKQQMEANLTRDVRV